MYYRKFATGENEDLNSYLPQFQVCILYSLIFLYFDHFKKLLPKPKHVKILNSCRASPGCPFLSFLFPRYGHLEEQRLSPGVAQ
jgi:hypothetical protein